LANHEVLLPTGSKKTKFFYGYIIVLAGFFIMFIMSASYSFGVFFKPLLAEFGWTRAVISGVYSLSFLLSGVVGIVMGRLNDRFGPRILVTASGFFLGLGYLLISQTSAIWHLYLFYGVVIGIGMSSCIVPLVSTVARW